jgi:hypothetical protein
LFVCLYLRTRPPLAIMELCWLFPRIFRESSSLSLFHFFEFF